MMAMVFMEKFSGFKIPSRASSCDTGMFFRKPDREKDRFYLLPGQGGRSFRRKNRAFLIASILAALVVSALLALGMYYANKRH
jgi:hypothetical protein